MSDTDADADVKRESIQHLTEQMNEEQLDIVLSLIQGLLYKH